MSLRQTTTGKIPQENCEAVNVNNTDHFLVQCNIVFFYYLTVGGGVMVKTPKKVIKENKTARVQSIRL